jgi:hypothetical protein
MSWAEVVQLHDWSNHRRILDISQFNLAFCDTNPGRKSDVQIKQNLKVLRDLPFPFHIFGV